jgi:8-oxo-dGTP pyrophosphatase MutT (NUDIX family)
MIATIRNSIKVILLNEKNELLLLRVDDPLTTTVDGTYHGSFWHMIGGEIEGNETVEETALREVYEETGIKGSDVELGPVVWYGEFDLIVLGKLRRVKQRFIVGRTKITNISLANLTEEEREITKKAAWFSFEEIKESKEIIYPVLLPDYLPDIIDEKYPDAPIEIDLGKQPKKHGSF